MWLHNALGCILMAAVTQMSSSGKATPMPPAEQGARWLLQGPPPPVSPVWSILQWAALIYPLGRSSWSIAVSFNLLFYNGICFYYLNVWALEIKKKKILLKCYCLWSKIYLKTQRWTHLIFFSVFICIVKDVPEHRVHWKLFLICECWERSGPSSWRGKIHRFPSPQNLPEEKGSTFTVKRHLYCEKKPLFRKINVYILECVLNEASLKVACCPVFMLWGWGDMAFPAIKYKNSAASGQPACIPGNRSSSNWYTTHWIALSLFNSIYTLASMYFLVFNRSP